MNKEIYDALHYCNMSELRRFCKQLSLPFNGVKAELIERLMHFVKTGMVLAQPVIPEASRARKNQKYLLHPGTLMLKGSYKNDAKTRAFFKSLLGPQFHFTAFGIDWLNERWLQGKPPTYQEFADMWQKEVQKRKHQKPEPKKEWAYITFVQHYGKQFPNALKEEIMDAWYKKRMDMVAIVQDFF